MMFGPDGMGLPPEIEEALRNQMDRAEMSAEATRHDLIRFFNELTSDQLVTMRTILHHCSSDESGRYPSHLEGFISGILQFKFEVCVGCGKKHDDPSALLPNYVGKDDPLLKSQPQDEGETQVVDDGTEQLSLFSDSELMADTMLEYDLRLPNDGEVESLPSERPVICNGCGALYQSLEDRMLRAPGVDGCYGCQHKAAHG